MAERVQFASLNDGREVAYSLLPGGDGPIIVHPTIGPWPLDLLSEEAMYSRFLQSMGRAGRVVIYDRPGLGSSDPFDEHSDWLDQMAATAIAVLDALQSETAWFVGSTLPEIATVATQYPERVAGSVLINPLSGDRWRRIVGSAIDRERTADTHANPSRADDPGFAAWLSRAGRMAGSAVEIASFMRSQHVATERFLTGAEPLPPRGPSLMIRRREAMAREELDFWQRIFTDTECVTIEGADSGVMGLDAALVGELCASFISGEPLQATAERRLVAVLFTDLVESTPRASASGDAVWRSTLDRYEAELQRAVQFHNGSLVKYTGDGALATFPSGSEAVAAGLALRNSTRDLGMESCTGIHVGEVEMRDDDIAGIAVNLAARVMGQASAGEILVTSTVVSSTTGGSHRFGDRGAYRLKGIDDAWELFVVDTPNSD